MTWVEWMLMVAWLLTMLAAVWCALALRASQRAALSWRRLAEERARTAELWGRTAKRHKRAAAGWKEAASRRGSGKPSSGALLAVGNEELTGFFEQAVAHLLTQCAVVPDPSTDRGVGTDKHDREDIVTIAGFPADDHLLAARLGRGLRPHVNAHAQQPGAVQDGAVDGDRAQGHQDSSRCDEGGGTPHDSTVEVAADSAAGAGIGRVPLGPAGPTSPVGGA